MINNSADKLNLCVFGDSIGKGMILKPESGRYEALNIDLNELLGKSNINLKNYSMMGCTITKGLSLIKRHASELCNYENIFLEFGGNDCDYLWNELAENPDLDHHPQTPPEQFEKLYAEAIEEIRKNGGRPIMLSLPPLEPMRFFKWISKKLNKENIMKWMGSVDTIYRWQELYNLKVVILANKLSVPLIDIRSAFLLNHQYRDLLCEDGMHPNKAGHELIYKTIAQKY